MPVKRVRIRPGDDDDAFTADDYNAIVDEIARLSNLTVTAPLSLVDGADGRTLTHEPTAPFYGVLSGPGNPYGYAETYPQAGGTWVSGPRSGSDAYEANTTAGLGGKTVLLQPTVAGDLRFQYLRGGSCDRSQICVQVIACGGVAYNTDVTVNPGGLTCNTGASGICCITVTPGTYTVSATVAGGFDSAEVTVAACDSRFVQLTCVPTEPLHPICITVLGCGGVQPIENATVNLNRGGFTIFTGDTDADGTHCFSVSDFDPFDVEILPPATGCGRGYTGGILSGPSTVSASLCGPNDFTYVLAPGSGWHCCGNYIVKDTLHFTYGGFARTATWNGSTWTTCFSVTTTIFPGSCSTPPYYPPQVPGSVNVQFFIGCAPGLGDAIAFRVTIAFDWGYCQTTQNMDGSPNWNFYHLDGGCPVPLTTTGPSCVVPGGVCQPCSFGGLGQSQATVHFVDITTCPLDFTAVLPSTVAGTATFGCGDGLPYVVSVPVPAGGGSITFSE
jgi:hypothetical protein